MRSLLVLFAATLSVFAQAPSLAPVPKGLRVLTVGHSFHAWVGPLLKGVVASAGIQGHEANVMSLGGSTVLQCWDIPHAKDVDGKERGKQPPVNAAKNALTAGTVDVLTLSPIWMPDEGIDSFAELGLAHNPNLRITVQEFWMPNDTYEPKYPLDTRKQPTVDHDKADLAALKKAQEAYDRDVEAYVAGVNKKLGHDAIAIVPVGRAVLALREKIVAGQAPGIAKQSEIFRDPWGHPLAPLQALSVYCHYAVIYHRSPIGLPVPQQLGKYPADLNLILQKLAWDAVTSCPMSGVKD